MTHKSAFIIKERTVKYNELLYDIRIPFGLQNITGNARKETAGPKDGPRSLIRDDVYAIWEFNISLFPTAVLVVRETGRDTVEALQIRIVCACVVFHVQRDNRADIV